ncbi:MAG: DUF1624 domain-containing protein [Bacteroidetes bacterium]|nr:MAG: DUF1624 domain-containing protein [Bacteroidota bacterium]
MAVVNAPATVIEYLPAQKVLNKRIESIDLVRGVVMIIMALDHVRDYFHYDAFMYSPTDLSRTNVGLFFTRFITHYCAPVFVFLAGTSSSLYGLKRSKSELSFFLLTRGVWLVLIEIFAVGLFRTFNLAYTFSSLQVIWAIGLSMMALSAIIYMNRALILLTGLLLVVSHNLLDTIHVQGNSLPAFLWSILHDEKHFTFGRFLVFVHYPVLPWLGVMILGYCLGSLYAPDYDPRQRKRILRLLGVGALGLFVILRLDNWYGDAAHWSVQTNAVFSLLSFLNVTKYPPSLLYLLITLAPALILLAKMEKPLNSLSRKIVTFGRVPMFYYLAHILLIHILAVVAALITGHSGMGILNNAVNSIPELKGYGFGLAIVYTVWIAIVLLLYPLCKWFERYKRNHQSEYWWLSYL